MTAPDGLGAGGRSLWDAIADAHDLDAPQLVQLTEACRAKDRLDAFDEIVQGKGVAELLHFRRMDRSGCGHDEGSPVVVEVKFDNVIGTANTTANLLKQLLAALRLPDEVTGKKPQYRGARGGYSPKVPLSPVSSLDRVRARSAGVRPTA